LLSETKTIRYLRRSLQEALSLKGFDEHGNAFIGGLSPTRPFRDTQREACEAYRDLLDDPLIKPAEKASGYFEIPTGIGKVIVGAKIESLNLADLIPRLDKRQSERCRCARGSSATNHGLGYRKAQIENDQRRVSARN
jgi:hypothetical protein